LGDSAYNEEKKDGNVRSPKRKPKCQSNEFKGMVSEHPKRTIRLSLRTAAPIREQTGSQRSPRNDTSTIKLSLIKNQRDQTHRGMGETGHEILVPKMLKKKNQRRRGNKQNGRNYTRTAFSGRREKRDQKKPRKDRV